MLQSLLSGLGGPTALHVSLGLLLVKATLILIAAIGITLAMQRASAGARHLVWLVTLATLLLVPALTAWSPLRLAILPAAAPSTVSSVASSNDTLARLRTTTQGGVVPSESWNITSDGTVAAPLPHVDVSSSLIARVGARVAAMSTISLLLAVWAFVMLAIGASLAWAGLAVNRIVAHARPLDAADWTRPLYEVADRLGLEDAPRLLMSTDAKMPFACGLLTPTIVLPAECAAWTLERRRAVLLHELAHVRRHDLVGHTLGRLACAVYWFHPLVWTAARQLRNESERACDDLALNCGTRATDYAEHLLDIVTSVRRDSTPSVALAMARRKEFEGRMLAILDPELRHSTPSRRQSAMLIATLALVSLTVGAVSPAPRTVRAATTLAATQSTSTRERPQAVPAPLSQERPLVHEAPHAQAYPDSGEPGVLSTFMSTRRETRTEMHQSTLSAEASAEASAAAAGVAEARAERVATAISPRISSSSLREWITTKSGQQNSDDRPILLAKVLNTDTSATLRRVAAWGLREYASTSVAIDALSNALRRDSDDKVREMAAWALADGDDGNSAATDALSAALKSDKSERVREISAWSLGHVGSRGSTDALSAALSDASSGVRMRAIWALGNVEPKQAPKQLVDMLKDKEPRVRQMTAWALFNIEDPTTAPALDAALKVEQDKEVQLGEIRALAAMGEKSVDALRGLLESSDPRVKSMAVRALAGGHAAGPWPWPWPEPRPYP
ncbi:MAG: putative rane protein [Gemmatimonadetes bacterium]|nr:putative rane protein [Gemmatimonadota bacterium]